MQTKKIALVTGASRGIGSAIAKGLASMGYHVIINYYKSEDSAISVANEITENGGSCEIFKCAVSKSSEVAKMYEYIKMCYGGVDLVVNNAGVSITKSFQDVTDEEWDWILSINLSAVVYSCREAVKLMLPFGSGKIINISSMWGEVGASMEVHYSATKAGVIGLTKALAKELAPSNIRVNCIAPGAIQTDMINNLNDFEKEVLKSEIPLGEIGQVNDISNLVNFLASDNANYITGQVIGVNGGMVI